MLKILLSFIIAVLPMTVDAGPGSVHRVFNLDNHSRDANRISRSLMCTVGDSSSSAFAPELEITAWNGECRFHIELLPDGPVTVNSASLKVYDNSSGIEFTAGETMSSDIYQTFDGDLEWEINLKKIPLSNFLTFKIDVENLTFYYQDSAAFSDEVIYSGPDWAHGSYAVYHSLRRHNSLFINGGDTLRTMYYTGKAFHILRPRAFDSRGNDSWCNLNIDTTASLMTIEVPVSFLAFAAYPVTVDPTFGKTAVGAWDLGIVNYRHTVLWNIGGVETGEGEITAGYVFCDMYGDLEGTNQVKIHSYAKGPDEDGSRFQTSSATVDIIDTSAHWAVCPMSGSLSDNTTYIASFQAYNSINNKLRIKADLTGWGDIKYSDLSDWNVPDSLTGYSSKNDGFSVYVEYMTGSAGEALPVRRRKLLSASDVYNRDIMPVCVNLETWGK